MSFIGPTPSPLELETERARERELEAKAERYAETHPDRGDSGGSRNPFRRLIDRIRRPGR